MKFTCRPAEIGFLDTAPIQLRYSVIVNTSLAQAFDALQDPATWPHWFPGMTKASAIGHEPSGPSRVVTLNYLIRFKEEFICWEPPSRIAYRVSAVSIPYADELVEDFTLTETDQGVEICYRIGMAVHHSLTSVSGLVAKIGESSYQKALANLKTYLER